MKFSIEKKADLGIGKWFVTIDGAEWNKVINKAETQAKSELAIPGFRTGKVPNNLIKKYLTENKILSTAHKLIVNKAYKFAFDQKSELEPFSKPELAVKKIDRNEYILELTFDLKPEIAINQYRDFNNIVKEEVKVSKEEIEKSLVDIQNRLAVFQTYDGPVALGDSVIFDFNGFIDNKPFKGGEAKDYTLEIGSGNFIAGFEDKMIGLEKNVPATITVKFPEDYAMEELKGKPAEFKILIKEIKKKILPEVNDELAKDVNVPNVNTLVDLKNYIKNNIIEQKTAEIKEKFMDELFREIVHTSTVVIPEKIVKKEAAKLYDEFEEKVKQKKLTLKEYKKRTGISEKEINTELFKDAKNRIENSLILDHVIKQENFAVTDEEIEKEYEKIAKSFGADVKLLKENNLIPVEQLKDQIVRTKAYDFLYENNGVFKPKESKKEKK